MKSLRHLVWVLALTVPVAAIAQWQWIDKGGRKVFSDQPPPADIPAKSILKQPGVKAVAPEAGATAAAAPASAPVPRVSGKDQGLQDKKRQAEAAEAEKKKAEEEKYAKVKEENCARVRLTKTAYDSGQRITRNNAKGEVEYLDDATRASEAKRLQAVLDNDCK